MIWMGMGGHRSMLMVMVWVWIQIRRKMLGCASHVRQGPQPCNFEGPWFSPKGCTTDMVCWNLVRPTSQYYTGRPWNIILRPCKNPCKLFIHDNFFGRIGLHLLDLDSELGRSRPFRSMGGDLRMQWSRAFSLMFDAALRLMCGGVPTAPNKASLLTSRCKRLGRAAGSGQRFGRSQTTARPPTDRPTYLPSKPRQGGRNAARVGSAHHFCQVSTYYVDDTIRMYDTSTIFLDTTLSHFCPVSRKWGDGNTGERGTSTLFLNIRTRVSHDDRCLCLTLPPPLSSIQKNWRLYPFVKVIHLRLY